MLDMIAVTMPGHHGDILSAVPAARELARRHHCQADFWIAPQCHAVEDLLAEQEFVRTVVLDREYVPTSGSCGLQPWRMRSAESGEYGAVYHLGFRETPTVPLPEYCCSLYGLPQLPHRWDLPDHCGPWGLPKEPFIVLAGKGETAFRQMFRDFVRRCPVPVVEVGRPGEAVAADLGAEDRTEWGFLSMAQVLSHCHWFMGLVSAPYVVASGFNCTKILAHDGSWDQRHWVRSGAHHYVPGFDASNLLAHVV